jgi:hypothetical protein
MKHVAPGPRECDKCEACGLSKSDFADLLAACRKAFGYFNANADVLKLSDRPQDRDRAEYLSSFARDLAAAVAKAEGGAA